MKQKYPYRFLIFAALFLVAVFIIENINKRFWLSDFKVYYGAANALMDGTQVYGIPFTLGSGNYKYSPFTIFLVLPLSLFPYYAASVLEYFAVGAAVIAMFLVTFHIVNHYLFDDAIKNRNWMLSAAFICAVNHLVRELHLGNINLVLLLLLCFSLLNILRGKYLIAGCLLAIVVMTKPFFILLLMPLVLRKDFKVILSFGIAVILCLFIPALMTGLSKDIELHKDWINTMITHTSSFPSNNTIENLTRLYISPAIPDSYQFFVMIFVCIGYLVFFLLNKRHESKNINDQKTKTSNLIVEWFILIAAMPSLFKTDTNHFLLSVPVIMILLCYVSLKRNYFIIVGFILLMILFGGNSSDLLGKTLASKMDSAGILGISNLILINWILNVHSKWLKPVEAKTSA